MSLMQWFLMTRALGVKERLERFIYLSDERHIDAKYVSGSNVF